MKSRSGRLLQSIVQSGEMNADDLARELSAPRSEIDSYLSGAKTLDLTRQLCLAKLVIERIPKLARTARALHGQAIAAMAVEARTTALHSEPPARFTARLPR